MIPKAQKSYPAIDCETFRKEVLVMVVLQLCCLAPLYWFYNNLAKTGKVTWQIYVLGVALLISLFFLRRWDLIVGRLKHLFPQSAPPSTKALGILLYIPVSCLLLYAYLAFAKNPRGDAALPFWFRRPKLCGFLLIAFNITLPLLASQASQQKAEKMTFWGTSPALFALSQMGKDVHYVEHIRDQLKTKPDLDVPALCDGKINSAAGRLMAMTLIAEQQARSPAANNLPLAERARLVDNSISILKGWDTSKPLISRMNPIYALSPTALPEAIVVAAANRIIEIYLSVLYIGALDRQVVFARNSEATPQQLDGWKKNIADTQQFKNVSKNENTWLGQFFPIIRARIASAHPVEE